MSDLYDSGFDMDEYGIWESLVSFCPPPTIQEIRQSLGSKLLNLNEMLWEELKALQHVLSACNNANQHLTPNSIPSEYHRINQLQTTKSASPTSINDISSRSQGSDSVVSISDLIQAVCNYDHLHDLTMTINAIKQCIIIENNELESKIMLLHEAINGEAESLSCRPTPRVSLHQPTISHEYASQSKSQAIQSASTSKDSSVRICSFCGRESSFEELVDGKSVKVSYTCALCKDLERQERKQHKALSKPIPSTTSSISLISDMIASSDMTTKSVVVDESSSQAKVGKFRSRLQSVRDEIYFFED